MVSCVRRAYEGLWTHREQVNGMTLLPTFGSDRCTSQGLGDAGLHWI